MLNESKEYKINAIYKKSSYEEENWTKTISTGKNVIVLITTFFRSGTFIIYLTDKEKEEILKKNKIILNDYNASLEDLFDGCDRYVEIENQDQYTEDEIEEINDEVDDEVDDEDLENNGWFLDDTIYGFTCGCELFEIVN